MGKSKMAGHLPSDRHTSHNSKLMAGHLLSHAGTSYKFKCIETPHNLTAFVMCFHCCLTSFQRLFKGLCICNRKKNHLLKKECTYNLISVIGMDTACSG